MLETGYVMLQIRLLIQALAKLLTGQTGEQMDSTLIEVEAVGKSMGLMDLAAQGRINEVENRFLRHWNSLRRMPYFSKRDWTFTAGSMIRKRAGSNFLIFLMKRYGPG